MAAGIGGVALFVFLFFDWFGAGIEGFDGGVSGWDSLGLDFSGFIVALTSFAGAALALLAMSGQKVNVPLPRGSVTAVLGLLSVAIIVWRIFANPGDLKFGLFLGLLAAIAIAAGALTALREDGFEALVPVPGGRKGDAAASAPAATPAPPPAATPAKSAAGSGGSTTTRRATPEKPSSRSTAKTGSRSGSAKGGSTAKSGGTRSTSAKRSSSGGKK